MKIESGKIVTLGYELFDSEGVLFESSEEEPIEFKQGDEEVLPGIEKAIEGQEEGADLELCLDPPDAYGELNPDGIVSVPRGDLPPDIEFHKDEWITVTVQSEEDDAEEELDMRIVEAGEEDVILDANHPLAGQKVTFKIKVLSVRDEG